MEKDVLQVLIEDHSILAWLAERLSVAKPGRARSTVFSEFARALGAHQTVIDQTVLPALKACGWPGVTSDVLAGHMALKRLLAEALALERDPAESDEAIHRVVAHVGPQCGREQQKLLPLLLKYLDDGQRSMMAFDAELHLTRLLGEPPKMHEDSDFSPLAGDLVEEAYVVLGSLPADNERRELHD